MDDEKCIKQQEIPFILDRQKIMKTVTKSTTCSDVIKKLPNLSCPLAVFESVDGVQKELSGKTKLLKVWRAHGPKKKVEFVIRKTNVHTKGRKNGIKLFLNKRKCEKPSAKIVQGKELSRETLKQVSDVAFFARYQKIKVDALNKKSKREPVTSEQEKLVRRISSRASVNSMDAFLAKADLDEMAHFLNFCGKVTAEKLGQKVQRQQTTHSSLDSATESNIDGNILHINKPMIQYSLTSLKLGIKEKFKVKSKVTRRISTGTISSTDTGYQSSGSEDMNASETKTMSQPESDLSVLKRHTFILSDDLIGPRHSTPTCILTGRSRKRRESDIDRTFIGECTVTSDKLKHLDECQGKDIILQKFMNGQDISASSLKACELATTSSIKRQRRVRYSMPVFSNQEEKCRFLWDLYCDSDSDSESETSEPCESLDIAFIAENPNQDTTLQARPRTLRRESAISNPNRFSLVSNRFSLVSKDNEFDTCTEGTAFDYSFDCSFPRMDESQSQEMIFDFS